MSQNGKLAQPAVESKVEELAIKLNGDGVRKLIDERVRDGLQEVLQQFLEEEAKGLCNAEKHQRTDGRKDYRNGHRQRRLVTRMGEVVLQMPRLRELAL
jgi:transposase-like protein